MEIGKIGVDESDNAVEAGRADHGNSDMTNTEPPFPGWLGNPFPKRDHGREKCIVMFAIMFTDRVARDSEYRDYVRKLEGRRLLCYCQRVQDDSPHCHTEVIRDVVEVLVDDEVSDDQLDGALSAIVESWAELVDEPLEEIEQEVAELVE